MAAARSKPSLPTPTAAPQASPQASPQAAPQAPQQAGGGVLGFLRSEGFGNFLQALGTSLMTSSRQNPLGNFAPAFAALNKASEGRALQRQEAEALVTALVENGVPLPKAQAVAFNPAAARILLDGTQRQAELAREEAARRADQERVDGLLGGGQGAPPAAVPAQPAQGATPQGEAAPGQDQIAQLENEIVENMTLAARFEEGTQSRVLFTARAENAKARLSEARLRERSSQDRFRAATPEEAAEYGARFGRINETTGRFDPIDPPKGFRFRVDENGSVEFVEGPQEGSGMTPEQQVKMADLEYARMFVRANSAIDDAIELIDENGRLAAGWGGLLADLPEGPAKSLRNKIDVIKGNLGFDELRRMREASPSGASGLGSLTEKELAYLQGVETRIDQLESPQDLRTVLFELKQTRNWFDQQRSRIMAGEEIESYEPPSFGAVPSTPETDPLGIR
jgi:hypothetical protein